MAFNKKGRFYEKGKCLSEELKGQFLEFCQLSDIELEPINGSQFMVKETFTAYQILQLGAINRLQLNVKLRPFYLNAEDSV